MEQLQAEPKQEFTPQKSKFTLPQISLPSWESKDPLHDLPKLESAGKHAPPREKLASLNDQIMAIWPAITELVSGTSRMRRTMVQAKRTARLRAPPKKK